MSILEYVPLLFLINVRLLPSSGYCQISFLVEPAPFHLALISSKIQLKKLLLKRPLVVIVLSQTQLYGCFSYSGLHPLRQMKDWSSEIVG